MKTLYLAALLVLALFVGATTAQEEWKETTSKEGMFKAVFPSKPRYLTKEVTTDAGKLKTHTFAATLDKGNVAFIVMYSDFPADHVKETGKVEILKNAQNGALAAVRDAKAAKQSAIMIGGHPGREIEVAGKDKNDNSVELVWRLYLVNNRLYQVGVASVKQPLVQENRKKFFDSFELLRQ